MPEKMPEIDKSTCIDLAITLAHLINHDSVSWELDGKKGLSWNFTTKHFKVNFSIERKEEQCQKSVV